jgi:predicted MFS family arabinose efflux permease
VHRPSERTLLFLVGAVQLVNVLDFMMVMPLGPDFARGLGIPASRLGLVGGAYTAAAALAGLLGAAFLDRFDRRRALGLAMLGLVIATAAGGLATGLSTMIAARLLAGAFGGPATSLSLSIVADVVPAERRGKALGAVMGAFSVASVVGVPLGLELARAGGWRAPFFAVAGLGLLVAGAAVLRMPSMTSHLVAGAPAPSGNPLAVLARPAARTSLLGTGLTMMASFAVVPNIAAHLQQNLGYPRERLGLLYMAGGTVAFLVLRVGGRWVDRFGAPRVAVLSTSLFLAVLAVGFAWPVRAIPVVLLFVAFMTSNSLRGLAMGTVSTRVPAPEERARFLSAQSAVQHLGSAAGAALSTRLLSVGEGGGLDGMLGLSLFSGSLAVTLPFLLRATVRRIRRREGVGRVAPVPADAA